MRTTERQARNDRIVQLRSRGLTVRKVAQEVGVSERHCARVLKERSEHRHSRTNSDAQGSSTSSASAVELLDRLQEAMADLASLAHQHAGRYDLTGAFQIEFMVRRADNAIAELRRRGEQLTPL
jgi:orotate phosphoribosyltransferase-like protein